MNTKVFVTNLGDLDYAPAEAFGEIVYVTQGYIKLNDLGKLRDKIIRQLDYSRPSDLVILSGPSAFIALFSILWMQKHGLMNVLSWQGKEKTYEVCVIGLGPNGN